MGGGSTSTRDGYTIRGGGGYLQPTASDAICKRFATAGRPGRPRRLARAAGPKLERDGACLRQGNAKGTLPKSAGCPSFAYCLKEMLRKPLQNPPEAPILRIFLKEMLRNSLPNPPEASIWILFLREY